MNRKQSILPILLITGAVVVGATACRGNSGGAPNGAASSAHAAASSALANPTVHGDMTSLENTLTVCVKENAMKPHPVQSSVQCAFPNGDTKKLEAYALAKFTPAVLTSKKARETWAQQVVKYYLQSEPGATVTPSPSAGTAKASATASPKASS